MPEPRNQEEPVNKKVGWLKILKTVFHNENTLLLTALSAVSSAIVCAIAYLYQRIILSELEIPVEVASDTGKSTIYYITFGILYVIAVVISQIVLRYTSLNTRMILIISSSIKKMIRAIKPRHSNNTEDSNLSAKLKSMEKRIKSYTKKKVIRNVLENVTIAIIIMMPACIIFQLASIKFSIQSVLLTVPLVLVIEVYGGFVQASFLLPKSFRVLDEHRRNMKSTMKDLKQMIAETDKAVDEWQQRRNNRTGALSKIWGTVSRVDVYGAIFSVAVSSFVPLAMAFSIPQSQKSFWFFEDPVGQQSYAIVYTINDKAVAKKAFIDGDTLFIRLHDQVYISYEGKSLTYRDFDKVILDRGALLDLEQGIKTLPSS